MKKHIQILTLLVFITGCSSNDPYPISGSLAKINEKQILDPMAPENNEGIVNDLEGNYGKKVMSDYQKSNTQPLKGQTSKNGQSLVSGGQ